MIRRETSLAVTDNRNRCSCCKSSISELLSPLLSNSPTDLALSIKIENNRISVLFAESLITFNAKIETITHFPEWSWDARGLADAASRGRQCCWEDARKELWPRDHWCSYVVVMTIHFAEEKRNRVKQMWWPPYYGHLQSPRLLHYFSTIFSP